MSQMEKTWQKPKLIILARGKPEEMVLAGCKIKDNPVKSNNKNVGCMDRGNCSAPCSNPGTS